MIKALTFICAMQTIAVVALLYLYYKTVADLTAKLMARDLHEVKTYFETPEKKNPADDIPKSEEVQAIEFDIENQKRVKILTRDAIKAGEEMLAKSWIV